MTARPPLHRKADTRALWRSVFGDSEAFMDIYFGLKYTDWCNHTLYEGERLAAAAQMLPYRLRRDGFLLPAGYVSGLCTRDDCRNRGYARHILHEALRTLHARGGTVACLLPADDGLRQLYARPAFGGFETVSYRTQQRLCSEAQPSPSLQLAEEAEEGADFYPFYRSATATVRRILLPSARDFSAFVQTVRVEGGKILTLRRNGRLEALCFTARPQEEVLPVLSLSATTPAVRTAVLSQLAAAFPGKAIAGLRPCTADEAAAEAYLMARIVHVGRFLGAVAVARPHLRCTLRVEGDSVIPENNATYLIAGGSVQQTDTAADATFTPGLLARRFLADQPLEARMLLD